MGYPAPKRRNWKVQIEFLDGTTIDASSDEDALERWQRTAAWWDETALTNPSDWKRRILARARQFYAARLDGISAESSATELLEALNAEDCLSLRRR